MLGDFEVVCGGIDVIKRERGLVVMCPGKSVDIQGV